jgi:hypothetical protein
MRRRSRGGLGADIDVDATREAVFDGLDDDPGPVRELQNVTGIGRSAR